MAEDYDYEEDEFFEDGISAAEQKHDLERQAREGADIKNEVDAGGPLGWYMRERRREALVALNMLTDVDPKDVVEIARQQAMVREYLNVRTWVREKYATGEHAKTILREEFADENRGRDGYGESTN
jgi:predicted site-specific integrase-resolvase